MNLASLDSLLAVSVHAGTSLALASLGALITERAGVIQLGVEGIMLAGALAGFAVALATGSAGLGLLAALAVGAILGAVHAFLSVAMRAEQVVSGLALNVFCLGFTAFAGASLVGRTGPRFTAWLPESWSQLPILGPALLGQDSLVHGAILAILAASCFLRYTTPGLAVRAAGDDPAAVDAMGLPLGTIRTLACMAGSALIAAGGAHLSLSYTPGWTEGMSAGRGWIAVALVVFGAWSPMRAACGALLFGCVGALQFRLQAAGSDIPAAYLNMLPYLATLCVLVGARAFGRRRRDGTPAALGQPYFREER